jgi:hypothetical protein
VSHRQSALVLYLNRMFSGGRKTAHPQAGLERTIGTEQSIENHMAAVARDIGLGSGRITSDYVMNFTTLCGCDRAI